MASIARRERSLLCDLLAEVGPDAPTLDEGWTTKDLAAHIIIREGRFDAAPGILLPPLAGRLERVMNEVASRPFPGLVEEIRNGPPRWSPLRLLDELLNTMELFIHHEDVRRAVPSWEPRPVDDDLEGAVWARLRPGARLQVRKVDAGVRLDPVGFEPKVVKHGDDLVTVSGRPTELALYLSGRRDHARVELGGSEAARRALREASLGL